MGDEIEVPDPETEGSAVQSVTEAEGSNPGELDNPPLSTTSNDVEIAHSYVGEGGGPQNPGPFAQEGAGSLYVTEADHAAGNVDDTANGGEPAANEELKAPLIAANAHVTEADHAAGNVDDSANEPEPAAEKKKKKGDED